MAGYMPLRSVSRGPVPRAIDRVLKSAVARVGILIQILQGKKMGYLLDGVIPAGDIVKLRDQWYADKPPAHWPDYEKKQEIVMEGYRKALELSLLMNPDGPSTLLEAEAKQDEIGANEDYGYPIYTLWICAGHHFQTVVARDEDQGEAHQVTLLILTPSPPGNLEPPNQLDCFEGIWQLSNSADCARLKKIQGYASGPHSHEEVDLGNDLFECKYFGEADPAGSGGQA